jgi:hypothetical protein
LHVSGPACAGPRAVATAVHHSVHRVTKITPRSGPGSATTDPLGARRDDAKRQGHRRGTHSAWPIKNPTLRDQDIKTKTAAVIDALLHR